MPSGEELKTKVCREIDSRAGDIINIAKTILMTPETGFREVKTSQFVCRKFAELGIPYKNGLAITGVKGAVSGGTPGPTLAVLGELDSLIVPDHPFADKTTGAAHVCGHNAQIAIMLGVAAAVTKSGILSTLAGRAVFIAVPAEEYIELEFRDDLRKQGKLHYLGGKPEFVKLGAFDDVDMAMMTHATSDPADKKIAIGGTTNGVVAKRVQFIGRSAHAGGSPHKGINALNAAMIALSAIHAQRETFQDNDTVRVHPIITKGGDAVNAVPADVRMEMFVRGKTTEAITDASAKVDRALRAGAMAIGAQVRIVTLPGYLPMLPNKDLDAIYEPNAASLVGAENVAHRTHSTVSTDMGDVAHIMPVLHPMASGATGTGHGNDYLISDYELAVLTAAKAMAMTVVDLLAGNAVRAKEVLAQNKPRMTKNEYLAFMDNLLKEEVYQG